MLRALLAATAATSLLTAGPLHAQTDPAAQVTRGLGALSMTQIEAAPRLAVVIGNSAYAAASALPNAVRDARAFADFLSVNGFTVLQGYDLDKRDFERLLRKVLGEIDADTEVVLFFAGHGIQIGRRNYLLPVDADLREPFDLPFETISLDRMIALLSARSKLQLVLLDSCRENPFAGEQMATDLTASLSETRAGFEQQAAPINTLLSYSTSPGQLALDGPPGDGSPYAQALLTALQADPDQEIGAVLGQVRRAVFAATDGRQVPWESSTLLEPFHFAPEDDDGATRIVQLTAPPSETLRAAPAAAPSPLPALEAARANVRATLGREIDLGAALATLLAGVAPDTVVSLDAAPERGALRVGDRVLTPGGAGAPLSALQALRYAPALTPAPPGDGPQDHAVTDTVRLVARDGQATARVSIDVALKMTECDWRMGAQFDPQGLSVSRLPNEIEPALALEACAAALAEDPANARLRYHLGLAQMAMRQNDLALVSFRAAGDQGHVRALAEEAALLIEIDRQAGDGPSEEALALAERGAAQGDPYAQHVLGKHLLRNGADAAARDRGFQLLSSAVEVGHTYAMNELGFYFLTVDGPHAAPARGLRYLEESAARADIYGFNNLGMVHARGLGGQAQDGVAAERWFLRAAEGGHPFAPGNLGRLYLNGPHPQAPDAARAVAWYDRGLDRGDAWSGANAAWLIANGRVSGMSPADAALRAAKAAALRDGDAADAARAVLAGLDRRALDTATQTLLAGVGEDIAIDGVAGPQTRAVLTRQMAARDVQAPLDSPTDRALAAATVFWRAGALRLDLF